MKIVTALGTRPEITKLSPLIPLLDKEFEHILIHTGQHYDYNLDEIFFRDLNLRKPNYCLKVGSASHAVQIAEMMVKIEEILIKEKPDWVIVFADPNTPLAAALAAAKIHLPLIHLEAGCRSFNKEIPEELNRIICDHCADLLLAVDETAQNNLFREGLPKEKIYVVGSTALEASLRNITYAREKSTIIKKLGLEKNGFVLVTVHRAGNTDNSNILQELVESFNTLAEKIKIVFPIHPRTKKALTENKVKLSEKVEVIEPQGYLDFLALLDNCLFVMSDSGGIQEEAVALNKPCLILRNETEWTSWVKAGKNLLIGNKKEKILSATKEILENPDQIEKMKRVSLPLNTNVSQKIIEVIKNAKK